MRQTDKFIGLSDWALFFVDLFFGITLKTMA